MALHEHDIGQAIVGPPDEVNVNRWKDFLTKPENLATALVLLAGATGPRRRGQTKLNKALTAGVGALGFRGGLTRGVEAQRADVREEQRTVEQQDADIAAQQASTQLGQGQLGVAQGTLGVNRQLANQAGVARPLAPSQIKLNKAQAAAFGRDPRAAPTDFATLFAQNREAALLRTLPGQETPNMGELALETTQQLLYGRLAAEGKITPAGIIATEEEMLILGITPPPPLPLLEPAAEAGLTIDVSLPAGSADRNTAIGDSLRIGGQFSKPSPAGQKATLAILKKGGGFEGLEDDAILDRLAEVRKLLKDKAALKTTSVEVLQEYRTKFSKALSKKEKAILRSAINVKFGLPGSQRLFEERT